MTTSRPAWVRRHIQSEQRVVLIKAALCSAAIVGGILWAMHAALAEPITCDNRGCSDQRSQNRSSIDANGNAVVGRRPRGCPHRFCGCEASLYVFGKIRPELNLAANWARKFPRTSPAPGMVAARSGHVFVLMSHVEGDLWMSHDGNSGGGLTREHVRSIRGFKIVNPHGSFAQN